MSPKRLELFQFNRNSWAHQSQGSKNMKKVVEMIKEKKWKLLRLNYCSKDFNTPLSLPFLNAFKNNLRDS